MRDQISGETAYHWFREKAKWIKPLVLIASLESNFGEKFIRKEGNVREKLKTIERRRNYDTSIANGSWSQGN